MKTLSKTDLKPATAHARLIIDRFTRQAVPFSSAKPIADQQALQLLLDSSGAGPKDTVLDVACGGGNVVCAFAEKVRHATGIDMTPAMLARARSHTSTDSSQAAAFNRMERLRDPSHVRTLPVAELKALFPAAGLTEARVTFYELRDELENLLSRSFPNAGDADRIHEIFSASARDNRLGIPIRFESGWVHYAYPVAVLVAKKPGGARDGAG